ncbi:MAG: glycosyltransferase family 4 protein [Candidatus Micrarchaeia archaeon]
MKILIMDIGSKKNSLGGELKVAAQLHAKLGKFFDTYYLGYDSPYLERKNLFLIEREKVIFSKHMHNEVAENWVIRAGYYFWSGRMYNLGISRSKLIEIFESVKPDIVLSNSIMDFPIIRYMKKRMNFKTIYIDHANLSGKVFDNLLSKNSLPFTFGSGIMPLGINYMKKKFFRYFDANVALNLEQKENMEKITKKVYHIPNGITKPKKDEKLINEFLGRFGLKGKFIFLYVGRLFERQKNISALIKAFAKVESENAVLVIIGSGPSYNQYINLARGNKKIIFTGALYDDMLNSAYFASKVFILPSFWEGFSLTILEAASHGLPLILSKPACPRDFAENKIHIETFDPKNVDELSVKMKLMLDSKNYIKAKRESEKIAKHFGEENMISNYISLINLLNKT